MLNTTPLLRLYAQHRIRKLRTLDPKLAQERVLARLLRRASGTKFGRDYNFDKLKTVSEYQARVPIRNYEEMWREYWQPNFPTLTNVSWPGTVPFFAASSGTTSGATKYIPYTGEIMAATSKAGIDLLLFHLTQRPKSQLLGGYSFVLTGSTDLVQQAPGVQSGDMSGICMKLMPGWARARVFPPAKDYVNIAGWEAMIERFAEASLRADIRSVNGAPSWMLLFLDRLRQLRPETGGRLAELYPNLELIIHGGMSFAPYEKAYRQLLEGSRAETREAYPASEGFFAVQDRGHGEGLRLIYDHGIFYEFVPLDELGSPNPTRHWLGNIEANIDYAMVLTTCAGLWSYLIGDTVRFIETRPPRLFVTGRTSYMLSAVGEHLIGEEIEECLLAAAKEVNLEVAEYAAGARFPDSSSDLAGHIYVVEFSGTKPTVDTLGKFSNLLDLKLQKRNEDYEAHRRNGFGLRSPEVIPVAQNTFSEWMRARGKFGGQNKVPRVISKPEIFSHLLAFVGNGEKSPTSKI